MLQLKESQLAILQAAVDRGDADSLEDALEAAIQGLVLSKEPAIEANPALLRLLQNRAKEAEREVVSRPSA